MILLHHDQLGVLFLSQFGLLPKLKSESRLVRLFLLFRIIWYSDPSDVRLSLETCKCPIHPLCVCSLRSSMRPAKTIIRSYPASTALDITAVKLAVFPLWTIREQAPSIEFCIFRSWIRELVHYPISVYPYLGHYRVAMISHLFPHVS